MAVLVGSARINEFGDIQGGQPGDQTGKECAIEPWYLHKYGWVIIRARSAEVRKKIAQDMRYICENDNVGYDQPNNQSLFYASQPYGFDVSKVKVKCVTDCARGVRVCVRYAGVYCDDFYTATEVSALEATGEFTIIKDYKYTSSSDYLLEGDILVTPTKGHTVVVLNNGALVSTTPYKATGQINYRSGPGVTYPVINNMTVKNGDTVPVYEEKNGFAYCRYRGVDGYASLKYLTKLTSPYKATGDVWLRSGPGVTYSKQIIISSGTYVHVFSEEGKWAKCTYLGMEGYASMSYLTEEAKYCITTGRVNMRTGPSILYKSIIEIPYNTMVLSTGNTAVTLGTTWYEVTYLNRTGWCSGRYIKYY